MTILFNSKIRENITTIMKNQRISPVGMPSSLFLDVWKQNTSGFFQQ